MLRQYIEREDDQQTTGVLVYSVAVLDCTSEDIEDNIDGLVESPSICDDESIEVLNINPDLIKEQQVKQVIIHFASTFTGIPGCTTYCNMTKSRQQMRRQKLNSINFLSI